MTDDQVPAPSRRRLVPLAAALAAGLLYGGYRLYQWRLPYEWSGTVEARTISIGSRVGGRVKEVLVREGDQVQAGQPLVTLEPGDLEAQRLAAEGQLEQAEANLEKLERGSRPEEIEQARARAMTASAALKESRVGARREQIAAAAARLQAQQVALEKAQLDERRMHKLFGSGAASQADRDNAEIQLKAALAQRDALREQLDELKNGSRKEEVEQAAARALEAQANAKLVSSGSRVEDIRAAHGQVEAAQGRLDQIKVMLDELTIRAPRKSRIESLELRPGDILAPNATSATLLEDDQLYVRIYVPETLIGHITVGQKVPITVDSFPGRSFTGIVEHINAVGEYSPRNLQTADERADQVFASRVGLQGGQGQLRAGMAAFIKVPK
jgi:HlyD family secretion protein